MENTVNTINCNNIQEKQIKRRSTIGSVIGVSAGFLASVAISKKGQPHQDILVKGNIRKSAKNLYNATRVDYEGLKGFFAMVLQAGGAAFGSLLGALSVYKNIKNETAEQKLKNDADKKAKIKEALFMTNNVLVPTALVKTGEWGLEKIRNEAKSPNLKKFASSKIIKALTTAFGLMAGMMTSVSITNKINGKFIEKGNTEDKKMRPVDFIYHVDDIIPILVSSKNPICDKIPIDRMLPLIYGFMGSEVGRETKE